MLQLEDDVVTKPGYLTIMKDFVLGQKVNDWILLEFSHLGFIGNFMHALLLVTRPFGKFPSIGKIRYHINCYVVIF